MNNEQNNHQETKEITLFYLYMFSSTLIIRWTHIINVSRV